MIKKELFKKIQNKYGNVGSWAVWEDVGEKPKSNMGHLNVFSLEKNPNLLNQLNNNIIMVGLNFSRPLIPTEPFKNFHDLNPSANDFKIRYAFKNTKFYGAYMTDIIKNHVMKDSNKVKSHEAKITANIKAFIEELEDLEAKDPIILAFGSKTYNILLKNLGSEKYSKLIKLTHYSYQISKENYKATVLEQIANEGEYNREEIRLKKNKGDELT